MLVAMVALDAYDVLGISPSADADAIKKAYRTQSLKHHPDKVRPTADNGVSEQSATDKFNEIKDAHEVISNVERRKVYDTFGFDLGEESMESEVWTMGASALLQPMAIGFVRTIATRLIFWFVSFNLIGWLVFIIAAIYFGLLMMNFSYQGHSMRESEFLNMHLLVGIITVVVFAQWLWMPLADAVGIIYLLSETVGMEVFAADMRVGVVVALLCIPVAWLIQDRWRWIYGLQLVLGIVMLISVMIAVGIMRLWLDRMHQVQSGTVATWRENLRKERKRLEDDSAELKRKAKAAGIKC